LRIAIMAIHQQTNSYQQQNGTNGHASANINGYADNHVDQSNGAEGGVSKPVGSYPPSSIEVLIVGTGLAGLSASIECIRKGHKVKVLERNSDINTSGAF
jgi:NADPH-dependent 2,4-dienoyl-CoA reductase/sulfur reductase-like enzyme